MGIYAKSTRNRKFFKRRPKKGGRRVRSGLATKRDLYLLSKQITATREIKNAFTTQQFSFGSHNAANEGIGGTYATKSLAIDGAVGNIGIPLGTAQNQRIGNNLRIKKVMLKMNFIPEGVSPDNAVPKPQIVKVYFGYSKPEVGRSRQSLPVTAGSLFKFGGSAVSPGGDVGDLNRIINTDLFTIVKKSRNMKLGNSAYYQSNTNQQDWNNNDFSMFKTYSADLTKFYPKNQHFYANDSGSSNRGLFMYVTTVPCDGTTSTNFTVSCNYELCISYTDS